MKLNNILLIILVLTLPLVIILTPTRFIIFNENYYHKQFAKYNVYKQISDADEVLHNITSFFKGKQELNVDLFTKNEKNHLKDVKILINKFLIVYYILLFVDGILIYFIIKKRAFKNLAKMFFLSSASIISLSLLLYLLRNSFSTLFVKFHLIFFPQGNWQFTLSSNLIKLFPEAFFYDTLYIIILISFIISLFLILTAIFLLSLIRRKSK